jgi:hypothetical protein
MRCRSALLALAGFVFSLPFAAAVPAADLAAGKQKAELCTPCHGEAGISQTENIPSLAGQPDSFLQWQLVFFRSGTRKNEQMQPIRPNPQRTTIPTCRGKVRRRLPGGDVHRATPTLTQARRPWRAWPDSGRNIF